MEMEKPVTEVVEKIAKECEEAGAGTWTITRIVKELSEQETSDSAKLRKTALEILKKIDQKTAAVFASFEKMQVRTSKLTIEPFDRGNIIRSLIRETNVNRGVAENIGKEVENKIKDLDIPYLNTALIREMANAKLLEYGHAGIRSLYARAGMPVFDIAQKIEKNAVYQKEILTEYNLLKVIPKELSDHHLRSDIFIAALHDFSTKPLSCSVKVEQKETTEETIIETLKEVFRHSKIFSLQPNINALNLSLGRATKKKKTREAAMLAIKALNIIQHGKKAANITLHAFTPEDFEKMEIDREAANNVLNGLLENRGMLNNGLEFVLCVDSKYKLKVLEKGVFDGLKVLNCNSQPCIALNGIAAKKPLEALFALNLEKFALEAMQSERRFFEKLDENVETVLKLGKIKRQELGKREYLKKEEINLNEFDSAIALYGLASAGRIISGNDSKKEVSDFCEKTVKRISSMLEENWVITELYDKIGIKRFEKENREYKAETAQAEEHFAPKIQAKNYYCKAIAENEKQLQELIEKNVPWIELRMGQRKLA